MALISREEASKRSVRPGPRRLVALVTRLIKTHVFMSSGIFWPKDLLPDEILERANHDIWLRC